MKVLLVNHFPLEGSGSGTYTRNIAEHLLKRGHEVHIIFPENVQPADLPGAGLHPIYFTGDTPPLLDALPFNFPCFTTHPRSLTTFADLSNWELGQYLFAFDNALDYEIEHFQPDIIHAQHMWTLAALAADKGIPCVVTAHGTDLMGCRKWPDLRYNAVHAVQRCSKIIAISKDISTEVSAEFPQAKGKMVLLPNGYNEDVFYPEAVDRSAFLGELGIPYHGEPVVAFVGKLTAFKGVDTLLYAAQSYEQFMNGKIITLISGNGEEESNLRQLSEKLGLQSVYFLAHCSREKVRRLYNCADVLAMPSRREPFGLVALEAMACGTPVVATDEGGLPEFVNHQVGSLVPVDSPSHLCAALLNEIDRSNKNPSRRKRIAGYAAKGFTQEKFVTKLEKVYRIAVNQRECKKV